jgi:hypothetical protein
VAGMACQRSIGIEMNARMKDLEEEEEYLLELEDEAKYNWSLSDPLNLPFGASDVQCRLTKTD